MTAPSFLQKHRNKGLVIRIEDGTQVASEFSNESTVETTSTIPETKTSSATEPSSIDVYMDSKESTRTIITEKGTETIPPPTTQTTNNDDDKIQIVGETHTPSSLPVMVPINVAPPISPTTNHFVIVSFKIILILSSFSKLMTLFW